MSLKVSVLTPIYNVSQFLPECLDSLLSQTLDDIEFICINDGSTDNSLEILKEYAEKDSRIVVVDKPNGGYGQSMNIGLSKARGEYIGIVESDDFVEPEMFESLYRVASANGCDIVRSNRFNHSEEGDEFDEILAGLEYGVPFKPLDKQEVFFPAPCIWTAIYRKEFLDENSICFLETPGASFQDTGFVYKSLIAAEKVILLEEAFLHYRVDNAGSSVKSSAKVLNILDEFESIDQFLEKRPKDKDAFNAMYGALKYQAYQWNYNRLGWEAKHEFIGFMADEFRELAHDGRLVRDRFTPREWSRIQRIIKDPEEVFSNDAPLVSVIVPAYNCEKYLKKTLNSLKKQTLRHIEVLIVDDGSTDATATIADDFCQINPKFTVIHQQNQGLSGARNTGLDHASGRYISFIDAEDTVPRDAIERLYRACENENADLSIGVIREFSPLGESCFVRTESLSKKREIDPFDFDLVWSFSVNNKLFRRAKIEEIGLRFEHGRLAEDGLFSMTYIYSCERITGCPTIVLNYRRNLFWDGYSITHSADTKHVVDLTDIHESIIKLATEQLAERIAVCDDELRKRELMVLQISYINELHRRLVSYLIELQYRRIWLLDEGAVSLMLETIEKHRQFINEDAWKAMCKWHVDLPLAEGLVDQGTLASIPHVSIVIQQDTKAEDIPDFMESIYHNCMPRFEVIVPDNLQHAVPEFYRGLANVHVLDKADSTGRFMQNALDAVRAPLVMFVKERVFLNTGTLLELWKRCRNSQADFVAAKIAWVKGDKMVFWKSQKVVFDERRSEGYSMATSLNSADNSFNNKLVKVASLRKSGFAFSDESAADAARLYKELSFKKCPDVLLMSDVAEADVMAKKVPNAKISIARYADRAREGAISERVSGLRDTIGDKKNAALERLTRRDTILFFSNRGELSDNLRLIYEGLPGKKEVFVDLPPHSAKYDKKVMAAIKRSKLIILDDTCQYLRQMKVPKNETRIVQLWHACGAFKKFGLDNMHVPAAMERKNHKQYSVVSVSSDYVRPYYASAFGIPIQRVKDFGVPRTDQFFDERLIEEKRALFEGKHPELRDKKIVLYCPTFRQDNGAQCVWDPKIDWDALSRELSDNVVIIVKPHPLERFDIMDGKRFDNILRLEDVSSTDVLYSASMLITDYSSIVFDASLLNVPTLFYCPDLEKYQTGFYINFPDDLNGELIVESEDLPEAIHRALFEYDWALNERFKEKFLGSCDGRSTERILKYIETELMSTEESDDTE